MTLPDAPLKIAYDFSSGVMTAQGLYIYEDHPFLGCLFFVIGGTFVWKSLQRSFEDTTKEGRSK